MAVEQGRSASELSRALPEELIEAVESQWIKPGLKALDIGCGRGQISAWLAQPGFDVLGADSSPIAIDLTHKPFGQIESLEFKAVDICVDSLRDYTFDVLVDRGCFHGIPDTLRFGYVKNISNSTESGARCLLFHHTGRDAADVDCDKVQKLFGQYWKMEDHQSTVKPLVRSEGRYSRREEEGLVFKLIRI